MEGVIVLAEEIVYSYNLFTGFIAVLFIVLAFIGVPVSIAFTSVCTEVHDPKWILGLFLTIISIFVGIFGFFCYNKAEETKTINYVEQKVIVEDTVQINDFLEYYEILDQDGKIYIVRERPID